MSEVLRAELERVAARLGTPDVSFTLERPRDSGHGDLATNLALVLAKPLRQNPRAIAERIMGQLELPATFVTRIELAGPGFINFWLAGDELSAQVRQIVEQGPDYGRSIAGAGVTVNVEFVSANPTGPLHVGHGRGAALGDGIAALYEWTGHTVIREFYVNDAGVQIDKLVQSLWARHHGQEPPEGGYHGEYVAEAAESARKEFAPALLTGEYDAARRVLRPWVITLMREEQRELLESMRVRFDVWTSEQSLYDDGKVAHGLAVLAERGLTYEKDGALWLRTSDFGDDKDRVLRKQDGTYTYLVPDIAYHVNKHERGFRFAIDVWGADHHGYIPRMRAVLKALGYADDFFDVALVQLVKVMKGGEEVKMSKRAGDYVTLRDLVDMVGVDAARYFFLMRRGDSPFNFDVDLATRQTDENPVFYVQMAHARMSGIFRVAGRDPASVGSDVDMAGLPEPEDAELAKALTAFPVTIERAARDREPHRICAYLEDLARVTHGWYHKCRVLGEPEPIERSRLVLARAARTVLANGLAVLGLTAPDRM
ncbi:MAG TPA: arginine--tRNA ligase [Gemmatimonadales bacterium]|nr:arginine--tRNA ligase [Gemmatimonadales bacterium]